MHPDEFLIFPDDAQALNLSALEASHQLLVGKLSGIAAHPSPVRDLAVRTHLAHLPTTVTDHILTVLERYSLVILGQGLGFDKQKFAFYLAAKLAQVLDNQHFKVSFDTISANEIEQELRTQEEKNVFVITNTYLLNFQTEELQKLAQERGHYLIVITDIVQKNWNFPIEPPYWVELHSSEIYSTETLLDCLSKSLKNKGLQHLEQSILHQVNTLNLNFSTPEQIAAFVQLINARQDDLHPELLQQIIQNVITDDIAHFIRAWFKYLSPKNKLICLAMTLFEGLYDEQFFRTFEEFIKETGHAENDDFRTLDYIDLSPLLSLFKLEKTDNQGKIQRIFSKLSFQRLHILEAAWHTHRRHILASLHVFEKLVGYSRHYPIETELFETPEKCRRFRLTASAAIGDISLISTKATQSVLRCLIGQNDIAIQAVAARAIARYRYFNKQEYVFETIKKWHHNKKMQTDLQALFEEHEKEGETAVNHFRAASALAIGYAAYYDKSNTLSPVLEEYLKVLAKENSDLIRTRMALSTLPLVVTQHFQQLQNWLLEVTQYQHFVLPIALGLAKAYQQKPLEVKTLLQVWQSHCEEVLVYRVDIQEFTNRDKTLATIILTYGLIDYSSDGLIQLDTVYKWLEYWRSKEEQLDVRNILLNVMMYLAEKNFSPAYSEDSARVLGYITENERDNIVEVFTEKYLQQRSELNGTGDIFPIAEWELHSWVNRQDVRPVTKVETLVDSWHQSENATLQQLAFYCNNEFGDIEANEKIYINNIEHDREKERLAAEGYNLDSDYLVLKRQPEVLLEANWLTKIILFIVKPFVVGRQHKIYDAILPIVLQDVTLTERRLGSTILRWRNRYAGDTITRKDLQESASAMSKILRWKLFLSKHYLKVLVVFLILFGLFLLRILLSNVGNIITFIYNFCYNLIYPFLPYP